MDDNFIKIVCLTHKLFNLFNLIPLLLQPLKGFKISLGLCYTNTERHIDLWNFKHISL